MANDLPLMSFCSHQALLREVKDCFIFMKASGDLGYLSGYKNGAQSLPSQVIALADVEKYVSKDVNLLTDQAEKFQEFLNVQEILGPTSSGIFLSCHSKLQKIADEKSFIKPNYIKPPSVSVPPKAMSPIVDKITKS